MTISLTFLNVLVSGPVNIRPRSLKGVENNRPISETSVCLEDKTDVEGKKSDYFVNGIEISE